MSFYRVTFNSKYKFVTVHNYGCVFRCPTCSYKLRSGANGRPGHVFPKPKRFLNAEQIMLVLKKVNFKTLYFMGGEPTITPELEKLLHFGKTVLGVKTVLGHCNGWKLNLSNLDSANVGLKAWDPELHLAFTGKPKQLIFNNFKDAFYRGIELKANVVFIPGLIDLSEIDAIAKWISSLSPDIPLHIMGYIPVPGQPYQRPSAEQMAKAVSACRAYLTNVNMSHLTPEQALNLNKIDDRFFVQEIT